MKFLNHSFKNKGFTLIEVAVVSIILLMVIGFLGFLSVKHFWIYNSQINELSAENDVRLSLDDVDNYVRQSYRVASSHDMYSTGAQILVLQIPSIDSSNQIIDSTYDYAAFYLQGDKLIRQIFADSSSSRTDLTRILASGVDSSNFSFTYDNADYSLVKEVTTSITVTQGFSNYQRSVTVSSKSYLRNYY